jgi:transcriptional regulator with XRE-family HTH domain
MLKRTLSYKKVLAERMKRLRKNLGLLQEDLARQLGISKTTISTIENEKQLPTIPIIIGMINNYRVSPVWLLKGEGEMFIKDKEPVLSQLEYFKKAFPGVPVDAEVIQLIESMAIPVLKNSLILKYFELKDFYRSQIEEYEKNRENRE